MIDGVLLTFKPSDPRALLRSVPFQMATDVATGEIKEKWWAMHQSLHYTMIGGRVFVRGSLQKFAKGENVSQVSWQEAVDMIDHLCEFLATSPKKISLQNLEIGCTLSMQIPTKVILASLLTYVRHSFENLTQGNQTSIGKQVVLSQHILKLYDKKLQAEGEMAKFDQLGQNLFRPEIKAKKMQYLVRNRGLTLADLWDKELQHLLNSKLCDAVSKVQIADDNILLKCEDPKHQEFLKKFYNPRNIEILRLKEAATFGKQLSHFQRLQRRYNHLNEIRNELLSKLKDTLSQSLPG